MKDVAGFVTFALLMIAPLWYCPLIVRRRLTPAPATWIIGTLAMNLSAWSYHAIPNRRWIENVTLYAAALEITIVLGFLLVVLIRARELHIAFDRVQKGCLLVMVATLTFWAFHKDQPAITFWTTQSLLVVALSATIIKALRRKAAFDSIGNWVLIFSASVVGSIPAILLHSQYGLTNSIRAILCSGTIVTILVYYDRKAGHARWNDEVETLKQFWKLH